MHRNLCVKLPEVVLKEVFPRRSWVEHGPFDLMLPKSCEKNASSVFQHTPPGRYGGSRRTSNVASLCDDLRARFAHDVLPDAAIVDAFVARDVATRDKVRLGGSAGEVDAFLALARRDRSGSCGVRGPCGFASGMGYGRDLSGGSRNGPGGRGKRCGGNLRVLVSHLSSHVFVCVGYARRRSGRWWDKVEILRGRGSVMSRFSPRVGPPVGLLSTNPQQIHNKSKTNQQRPGV